MIFCFFLLKKSYDNIVSSCCRILLVFLSSFTSLSNLIRILYKIFVFKGKRKKKKDEDKNDVRIEILKKMNVVLYIQHLHKKHEILIQYFIKQKTIK